MADDVRLTSTVVSVEAVDTSSSSEVTNVNVMVEAEYPDPNTILATSLVALVESNYSTVDIEVSSAVLMVEYVPSVRPPYIPVSDETRLSVLDRMFFRAVDSEFNIIDIIDSYDSIIWTEKYNQIGDFEVFGPLNDQLFDLKRNASYIFNSITSSLMVIEKPEIDYTNEDGSTITVSGRSIISVLDRRVLPKTKTILSTTGAKRISDILCSLIEEAFAVGAFNDATSPRYWGNLKVINRTPLTSAKLPIDKVLQFTIGDNLLDIVLDLCEACNLGIKCEFSPGEKLVKFVIYEGSDLSESGSTRLVFSDIYDNLISSKESISFAGIKNAAVVIGNAKDDTTDVPLLPQVISDNAYTGLDRRETFIKLNIDKIVYDGETERAMSDSEYKALLRRYGTYDLNTSPNKVLRSYDGEIVETIGCEYGTNFNIGDIVIFKTPENLSYIVRLEDITFSHDETEGKLLAPKFSYDVSLNDTESILDVTFELAFEDDFTNSNGTNLNTHNSNSWTVLASTASIESNSAYLSGSTLVRNNYIGSVFTFKQSAKVSNVYKRLCFGIQNASNYFYTEYVVSPAAALNLYKVEAGTKTLVLSTLLTGNMTTTEITTQEVVGGILKVWCFIDGVETLIFTRNIVPDGYIDGYIGIGNSTSAFIDDYKAYLPTE